VKELHAAVTVPYSLSTFRDVDERTDRARGASFERRGVAEEPPALAVVEDELELVAAMKERIPPRPVACGRSAEPPCARIGAFRRSASDGGSRISGGNLVSPGPFTGDKMQPEAQLDVVVPLVHRTVCSLQRSERAILDAADVPADPLVRAALRAGVDDAIQGLEALIRSLDVARRRLEPR
jgi:hypothetical protein